MKENRPEDRAVYGARRGRAQVTCDHLSAAVRYSHVRRYPHGDPGRGRAARARRRASRRPLIPHRQGAEIFNAGSGLWVQRAARLNQSPLVSEFPAASPSWDPLAWRVQTRPLLNGGRESQPSRHRFRRVVHVVVRVVIRAVVMAPSRPNRHGDAPNPVQNPRKRCRWTKPRRFRDREAPGSNPGPPTKHLLFELANKKKPWYGCFSSTPATRWASRLPTGGGG
jgi:hypothetical protein